MTGKITAAAAGLFALLLFVVIAGAGSLSAAPPPVGGCAVNPGEGGGATPSGPQQSAELNAAQMQVARQIVGVGKGMGIRERGTAIALGTAMQESTLDPSRSDGYGSGIFQQQGEYYADVDKMDPVAASAAFYNMMLKRVPNYDNPDPSTGGISFADAAQTVQASGAGAQWYARWEHWAVALNASLYSGTEAVEAGAGGGPAAAVQCAPGGGSGPMQVQLQGTRVHLPQQSGYGGVVVEAPNEAAAKAIAAGLSYLGTPYAWGGGSPNGPTQGVRDGGVADSHGDYAKTGFDCAGLTQYAWHQAGVDLTRPASTQLTNAAKTVPFDQAKPGDLLFWGSSPHHVALYLGHHNGEHLMLEAPQSGDVVKVSKVRTGGDFLNKVAVPS